MHTLPTSEAQIAESVLVARAERTPLEITGGGTKRRLGRRVQAAATLSTDALRGITLYRPTELVISARSGTPLSEITQTLGEQGQELAFEPIDHRTLYGGEGAEPTIGGVVACNLSGPRRVNAGAARDHLLGVRAVNGRGEVIKNGGRVVKNVTGYDLCKLFAGSFGTLGILTEVTLKVRPKAERTATLVLFGLDEIAGQAAMAEALGSPFDVTGAAYLPATQARTLGVSALADTGTSATVIRLEGFTDSVAYRTEALRGSYSSRIATAVLDDADGASVWADIRDVRPLAASSGSLWRVSTTPSEGPAVLARLRERSPVDAVLDWGGGLVWLAVEAGDDDGAAAVRDAVRPSGGHATLVRPAGGGPGEGEVFDPPPPVLAMLGDRIKRSFDPDRILNPGRMYAGV